MAVALSPKVLSLAISISSDKSTKPAKIHNKVTLLRRRILVTGGVFSAAATILQVVNLWSTQPMARAEEESDGGGGIFEAIESLLDPNEKTKKTGKSLPKAYLKSSRELVKNLRESLKEDPSEMAKFRRTADSAKDSIREFLGSWRGQQSVAQEESYAMLEKAIRSLAGFYSKAGPSAIMPEEVKSEILKDLDSAEEFL